MLVAGLVVVGVLIVAIVLIRTVRGLRMFVRSLWPH